MKRFIILGLKIFGILAAVFVVILLGAALIFNSSSVQKKVLDNSTEMLAERLQTKVKIDSVSINFLTFDVNLLGVEIEDREQRKMLQTEQDQSHPSALQICSVMLWKRARMCLIQKKMTKIMMRTKRM